MTAAGPDRPAPLEQAQGRQEDVLALVSQTGRRLDARQPQITRAMSDLLAAQIDEPDEDPQLVELLEASVEGNVKTTFHVLTNHGAAGVSLPRPRCAGRRSRARRGPGAPVRAL